MKILSTRALSSISCFMVFMSANKKQHTHRIEKIEKNKMNEKKQQQHYRRQTLLLYTSSRNGTEQQQQNRYFSFRLKSDKSKIFKSTKKKERKML